MYMIKLTSKSGTVIGIISGLCLLATAGYFVLSSSARQIIPAATQQGSELIRKDVKYCDTTNPSQEYDLYTPATKSESAIPIVVHIHGGGWQEGTKNNGAATHFSSQLTQKNIAFASIDYRLANEATYPAQNEDVSCAIEHLQTNSAMYGIDPNNMIVMGDSAGGHLAALEGLDATNDHIKAVIMLYGVSDLWLQITKYTDTNAIHYLGKKDEKLAKQASPLYQDLRDAPPFLLVHGTKDTIVPASESEKFAKALKTAGRTATYIPVDGASHGFIDGDSNYAAQTRATVLMFVEEQLKI